MKSSVSVSPVERKKFEVLGKELIREKLTPGFQIENYSPTAKKELIYAHDSPKNIEKVQQNINGKIYPRLSFYKWNPSWTKGKNTTLLFNKTLARAKEQYISAKNTIENRNFV